MAFVLGLYADSMGAGGSPSSYMYVDEVSYIRPQNALGYVASVEWSPTVVIEVDGDPTPAAFAAAKAAIADKVRASVGARDFADAVWCHELLPNGMRYVGTYYAGRSNRRVLSETPYACPHCAMVEARRILLEQTAGTSNSCVYVARAEVAIPDHMTTLTGIIEIAGETRPPNTSTIRDYTGAPGFTCSNCGRLEHNRAACAYAPRHHLKIGVEVEGRFLNLNQLKDLADDLDATYSGDGSIHESPDSGAEGYEFKTKPGNLRETIEQVVALYPDETDGSCGMHVHMSFPQDCITLLNTAAFFAYFNARWTKWGTDMNLAPTGEFFKRLEGDNDYCLPNRLPRVNMHTGDRYEQLNFTAWTGHKTLECRLLPMFRRSSLAVAAIQELVAIYEDFLASPESHGLTMPSFVDAGADVSYLTIAPTRLTTIEIDGPAPQTFSCTHEMELSEIPPPAENMVRIALPVNQPITVEALSARLTALRAA